MGNDHDYIDDDIPMGVTRKARFLVERRLRIYIRPPSRLAIECTRILAQSRTNSVYPWNRVFCDFGG